jgi:hypothetical protein
LKIVMSWKFLCRSGTKRKDAAVAMVERERERL